MGFLEISTVPADGLALLRIQAINRNSCNQGFDSV